MIRRRAELVMAGIVVLWLVWFSYLALHRFYGLGFGAFDLGIFDQGLWLLSEFKEPFITLRGLHLFADHASYIMFLLVPIYWVWANTEILVVLAAVIPAVTGWLSFKIAREEGLPRWPSVMVGATVLALPAMAWTPWDAFHPETFAIALLPASYLAARRNRFWLAVLLAALILLVKEDSGLLVGPFAVYMWFRWKEARKQAMVLAGLTVVVQAISLLVVLPAFSPTGELIYTSRYSWDLMALATWPRAVYLVAMFAPAVLAFWAPAMLLVGVPITLANLASAHGYQHEVMWHYSGYLLGVLAVAVPLGTSRVFRGIEDPTRRWKFPYGGRGALTTALLIAVVGLGVFGPDLVVRWGLWGGINAEESATFDSLLEHLPDDAVVTATWNLTTHMTHRTNVYMAPNPFSERFWGVNGELPPPHDPNTVEFVAVDARQKIGDVDELVAYVRAQNWEVVVDGPFILFKRPTAP